MGELWIFAQLSTRHPSNKTFIPRGVHGNYKCIQIVSGFVLRLPAGVSGALAIYVLFLGLKHFDCHTVLCSVSGWSHGQAF